MTISLVKNGEVEPQLKQWTILTRVPTSNGSVVLVDETIEAHGIDLDDTGALVLLKQTGPEDMEAVKIYAKGYWVSVEPVADKDVINRDGRMSASYEPHDRGQLGLYGDEPPPPKDVRGISGISSKHGEIALSRESCQWTGDCPECGAEEGQVCQRVLPTTHHEFKDKDPLDVIPAGAVQMPGETWCVFCKKYHVGGLSCMGHHP